MEFLIEGLLDFFFKLFEETNPVKSPFFGFFSSRKRPLLNMLISSGTNTSFLGPSKARSLESSKRFPSKEKTVSVQEPSKANMSKMPIVSMLSVPLALQEHSNTEEAKDESSMIKKKSLIQIQEQKSTRTTTCQQLLIFIRSY